MPQSLRLYLLGAPRLELKGRPVETDTRKAVALLAYLAVSGEPLSRDSLAAFLWPEFDERRAKAALRRTLSTAKAAAGDESLLISREALGMNHERIWSDLAAFQAHLSAVTAHHPADEAVCDDCLERLESAVALYRDDFLAGFSLRDSLPFDDWQLQQSEILRRELAHSLAQMIGGYIARDQFQAGITVAQRWLQLDPLREQAHRQLMRLFSWSGQRSAALMQYRHCVRALEAELGVPPLAETTELYEAIQADRLPPPVQTGRPAPLVAGKASPPERPLPAAITLVGREAELATMRQMVEQAGAGGRLLILAGEAGIGKTSLAETFLNTIDGARLQARCYAGESHLAYAPFVQAIRDAMRQPGAKTRLSRVAPSWLAETARLLPELAGDFPDLPAAPPFDWPGAAGRFLEGLSQVLAALLAGSSPGVLWLDDVHWIDSASLDLLAFLTHRQRLQPYLILVGWQGADLSADQRLHQLLAESRQDGSGKLLSLSRLQLDDVVRFVAEVAGELPQAAAVSQRLYEETEGLPFLIAAYLQALPEKAADDSSWYLPPSARDLFHVRLAQTSETQRQLLQAAAVVGRAASFDLLLAVSGRSEGEAIAAVEALIARHLLVEPANEPLYEFYHHKLRELVYEETSLIRRRLLHRRTAQALSGPQAEAGPAVDAARIAGHYLQAGHEQEAAAYFRQAGDDASSLFAHRDALDHYQSALALGHPQAATLHEVCGDLCVRLGRYAAALASYERAAALSRSEQLSRLEHRIGQVYYRRGEWDLAEGHFAQAELHRRPEVADPDDLARLYIDWSHAAFRAGQLDKAMRLARQAESLAGRPTAQAQTQNLLGILARGCGDMASAIRHFQSSLAGADAHQLLDVQIAALNNLALTEMALDQPEQAHLRFTTALRQCQLYGDRHWEAALHNNLADLLHQMGQAEAARAEVKKAVTIYAEIGREAGGWQPEIWKLTEW